MPPDLGPAPARGRQSAAAICAECHGPDLDGGPAPVAYDLEGFPGLIKSGVPLSGRDLGIMTSVAKRDFSRFTDEEISALHGYLVARVQRSTP